jgi:hypothetical protein
MTVDPPVHRVTRPLGSTVVGIAVLLVVAAMVAGAQWILTGNQAGGVRAITIAWAAILPGALLGWTIARLPFSSPAMGAASGLAGILLRMALPLVCLAWLTVHPPPPGTVSPANQLVVAYLALLAADIAMHVILRKQPSPPESDPLLPRRSREGD